MFGEPDIAAMLSDLCAIGGGVEVMLGATTVNGLIDRGALEILQGEMPGVVSADEVVHIPTGSLPGLASGASITVDGAQYVVMKTMPYEDGAMTRVLLRKP